jgi:hypothetical protein
MSRPVLDASRASVEGVVAVGSSAEVEVGVVGSAVVVAAQGEAVVEVGGSAATPGESVVVDLAPGEGSGAAGDRAGVVRQREGSTLAA